jgi:hypothetical protein
MEFDVIGDIHGQAGKLDALLAKLGYIQRAKLWVPPQGRQAIFVGDLIDRGPEQIRVVDTVRRMVDAGYAQSIMGNHEFNAIGYVTPRLDGTGGFLRKHSQTNIDQHAEFLRQVTAGSLLHVELVDWFRTLPPYLDLGGIRVVHAWWHQPHVDAVSRHLAPGQTMSDEFLHMAYDRTTTEWSAMEGLTKGLEVRLPTGHSFLDHSNVERFDVRTKWWLYDAKSYREVAILQEDQRHKVPDLALPSAFAPEAITGTPVFIGHYWMTGTPSIQSAKVACLDYSAAKSGPLVAYRWSGEELLNSNNFVLAG